MTDRPGNSIRAQGEGDRSPEFVLAREALIEKTIDFLDKIKRLRDFGERLPNNEQIFTSPRLTTEDIDPFNARHKLVAEEIKRGTSLTGDNITSPLSLQSVKLDPSLGIEIITVSGGDPMGNVVNQGVYSTKRQLEPVISFSVRNIEDETEKYFRFSVTGDGAVKRSFIDDKGWNQSSTAQTEEELAMADGALDQIIESLGPDQSEPAK